MHAICETGSRFFALLLLVAGCAHTPRLVPAPDAQRLAGDPEAAVASAAGVQVTVRSRAWKGVPRDLESIVTPLQVTVENGSHAAIRIRYRDFTLTGPDGLQSGAIPPLQIQRPGMQTVALAPTFAGHGFLLLRRTGHGTPRFRSGTAPSIGIRSSTTNSTRPGSRRSRRRIC